MTDSNVVSFDPYIKESRVKTLRRALDAWNTNNEEWPQRTMALALELKAARDECGGDDTAYGVWLAENGCDDLAKDVRVALIGMGSYPEMSRRVLLETTSRSVRLIWASMKPVVATYRSAAKGPVEQTLPPEAPAAVATEAEMAKPEAPKTEVETDVEPDVDKKKRASNSKLFKLGEGVGETLTDKFKHPRMLSHFLGTDDDPKRARLLRYLAVRVKATDYPEEFLASKSWEWRLLYPHLPQKMVDAHTRTMKAAHKNHSALSETEKRFVLTQEFSDGGFAASNKAALIFQSVKEGTAAKAIDPSLVYRPTFAGDEGKAPVIVRGTQVWPREVHHFGDKPYGYDDLRCAYNLANDILLTFAEPRDSSMATKSLKLRHILSWLPGGYNSVGVTSLDAVIDAFKVVVQAYSTNKSDVMRPPEASLRKTDE